MSFIEFLDKIDQGDEGWYLTTPQDFKFDQEGQPYINIFLTTRFPDSSKSFQNNHIVVLVAEEANKSDNIYHKIKIKIIVSLLLIALHYTQIK